MKKTDIIKASSGMEKTVGEIMEMTGTRKKFWLTVIVCSHIRTMTHKDARKSTIEQLIANCGTITE